MTDLLWKPYMQWCIVDSVQFVLGVAMVMLIVYWVLVWVEEL